MLIEAARTLPYLRREAESRMTDTCTVEYRTGETAQDEDTGAEVPVYAARFTSPCRIADGRATAVIETGGRQMSVVQQELHLPLTAATATVTEDDRVTMSADSTPEVAGRTFRVVMVPVQSQATARRVPIREV